MFQYFTGTMNVPETIADMYIVKALIVERRLWWTSPSESIFFENTSSTISLVITSVPFWQRMSFISFMYLIIPSWIFSPFPRLNSMNSTKCLLKGPSLNFPMYFSSSAVSIKAPPRQLFLDVLCPTRCMSSWTGMWSVQVYLLSG